MAMTIHHELSKSQREALRKAERKFRKKLRQTGLRASIFYRERGRCYWCGVELFLITEGTDVTKIPLSKRATLDHVMPRSRGGSNKKNNLVTACHDCNNNRQNCLINPVTKEPISPRIISVFLK